jgi:hypothetical protein
MTTLEREREIAGAEQDMHGRYYVQDSDGYRSYGYRTHFSGLYVCYTDGHYCECGEGDSDDVETVSWSSSNPTGEIAGECDKCATSYDLSSRDNRCGDCGNCDTCCTHKGEVA